MGRPKQDVGRLLDELETLGYIRRRPDPRDRRGKLVVPTGRGRDEREQATLILAEIEARHAARIGADSYSEFRRLLRALVLPPEAAAVRPSSAAANASTTVWKRRGPKK